MKQSKMPTVEPNKPQRKARRRTSTAIVNVAKSSKSGKIAVSLGSTGGDCVLRR
jgi:hypothetical protein